MVQCKRSKRRSTIIAVFFSCASSTVLVLLVRVYPTMYDTAGMDFITSFKLVINPSSRDSFILRDSFVIQNSSDGHSCPANEGVNFQTSATVYRNAAYLVYPPVVVGQRYFHNKIEKLRKISSDFRNHHCSFGWYRFRLMRARR